MSPSEKFSSLRAQAKELLKKEKESLSGTNINDIKSLVEELNIHQIELEMQNEELKKAQDSFHQSEEKYKNLYYFSPVPYFTLNSVGNMLELNLEAANIIDAPLSELINRPLISFVEKQSRPVFYRHLKKAFKYGHAEKDLIVLQNLQRKKIAMQFKSVRYYDEQKKGDFLQTVAVDISERISTQKKMAENEEFFHAALGSMPTGICITDTDFNVKLWNEYMEKLTAVSFLTMKGKNIFTTFPDLEEHGLKDIYEQVIKTGTPVSIDDFFYYSEQLPRKEYYLNINAHPLFVDEQKIKGVLFVIENVSEKKELKKTLLHNKQLIQNVIDQNPSFIYIHDIQKQQNVFSNSGLTTFLGYTPDELKDMGNQVMQLLIHPEDIEAVFQSINELRKVERNEVVTSRYRMKHKNGMWRWFSNSAKVSKRNENDEVTQIIGTIFDITEMQKNEQELKESRNYFQKLFDLSNDAILIHYFDGTVINANNRAVKLLKQSITKMTTKKIQDFIQFDTERDFLALFERVKHSLDIQFEVQIIKNGGEKIEAEFKTSMLDKEKGILQTIIRDVTQQKKAEKQLTQSKEKLSELNTTKDKFFSILAHDLKSPFSHIMSLIELLINKIEDYDKPKIERMLNLIHDSSVKTYKLLDNLLTWSRAQSGKLEYEPEKIQLSETVSSTTDFLEPQSNNKKITVVIHIPDDLYVYADRDMLDFIFRNFISNAIKFTRQGGKIEINAQPKAQKIEIIIKDTGVGMDVETLNDLFRIDKTNSKKGTDGEEGTGLGLILCKEFINLHKSTIQVESTQGKGSVFKFSLPVANG